MHDQVFGRDVAVPELDPRAVAVAKAHLARNGLAQKDSPVIDATEFTLPKLQGSNIEEHFFNIGLATSAPYLELAKRFAEIHLPPQPESWQQVAGWTRYNRDGSFEPVEYPTASALVFDVETLYKIAPFAVMATAASSDAWYSWTSPWLLGDTQDPVQLMPMPGRSPSLLIGHNVGYDRARTQDEYNLHPTQNRFLDTMSLHMAVTGLSSHQRAPWMRHRKKKELENGNGNGNDDIDAHGHHGVRNAASASTQKRWEDLSAMNSLRDVAKLHCNIDVDKSARDWFSTEQKDDVLHQFQELMTYCANDVGVTHKVFCAVLPAFLRACPNPVSFSGVLHMGSSFLPVDGSWKTFLTNAEGLYNRLSDQVESELHKIAEVARKAMFKRDANDPEKFMHETDPWLSQLDWTPKKARTVPARSRKSSEALLEAIEEQLPELVAASTSSASTDAASKMLGDVTNDLRIGKASQTKPVEPEWFRLMCNASNGQVSQKGWDIVLPLLLKMTANGYTLHYNGGYGWCVEVPESEADTVAGEFANEVEIPANEAKDGFRYFWLSNVVKTSLFNAKSRKLFNDTVLSSSERTLAKKAFELSVSSVRNRMRNEDLKKLEKRVLRLARKTMQTPPADVSIDPWLSQLDWAGMPGFAGSDCQPPVYESLAANSSPSNSSPQPSRLGDSLSGVRAFSTSPNLSATEVDIPQHQAALLSNNAALSKDGHQTTVGDPSLADKSARSERSQRRILLDCADTIWPQWYWDMSRPRAGEQGLNLSIRSRAAPLLLRLRWLGHVLVHSRQHGWLYKVPKTEKDSESLDSESAAQPVVFIHDADYALATDGDHVYFKLPHKDGAEANVGSPLSKTFVSAFEEGTLSSEYPAASAALDMNAQCSYWISARERVLNQLVVWQDAQHDRGFPVSDAKAEYGMILPQVVTMGTVTRRAVESTWLAASNAKRNRLGSELKAMIRAPPGYAIVGADVDSEELWICCVMGDAQFGLHGATAIGWMTLEGTKSAGTDLHSKTASILGISRDKAKVFNYSRIYGAGVKHAVQLLMQANSKLTKRGATDQAQKLYAATKGLRNYRSQDFKRGNGKFWYGGTESHVFNTLEQIAMARAPRTPALGCGITSALAKENLPETEKSKAGEDFMPSRINWVVQSSGVDYLHLLIVSMQYLTERFKIEARFMISVHDEIRYLVKDSDKYRAALALQISNMWTRAIFSHRLRMQSLPQSCAFFSAVDVDHVFRKEVNMDCVTPSQPIPIPHGISQDIDATLKSTNGTLFADGRPMEHEAELPVLELPLGAVPYVPSTIEYRAPDSRFLEAQNARTKLELARIIRRRDDDDDFDVLDLHPPRPAPAVSSRKSKPAIVAIDPANYADTASLGESFPDAASLHDPATASVAITQLRTRRAPRSKRSDSVA